VKIFFLKCWSLIHHSAKRKIFLISLITIGLNLLDLLAVSLIGLVGAVAYRGIQSQVVGDRTAIALEFLRIENLEFSEQIVVIGVVAFLLLVLKSVLVYYFTKKIYLFMSYQSAYLSEKLTRHLTNSSVQEVQKRSSQDYAFHIITGTNHLMMGVVGTAFSIMSDVALFVFLISLLLIADLKSALISALIFIAVGVLLHKLMQSKALNLGKKLKELSVGNNEKILELTSSFREIVTRNTQEFYSNEIFKGKVRVAEVSARQKMMPLFSKHFMEVMVFAMFLGIAGLQFLLNDTSRAVGNLALFLAASTRISPAVLRIQQGSVQIKSAMGGGESTLRLIETISDSTFELTKENIEESLVLVSNSKISFVPSVDFKNVTFQYHPESKMKIESLSLEVRPYQFVAFVGPSGAGKSTLIDLLFGLLSPEDGEVLIGGVPARVALKIWPGECGYVPQNVMMHKGSVMSNLLMGLERSEKVESRAEELLKMVNMHETVMTLNGGYDATIDERGGNLSGGQRQRLGIARALMTNPRILVMDESTSMLDATSENIITDALLNLREKVTLIVIAHRLSTVKSAERLFYIDDGKIRAEGNFESLRNQVQDFDIQAKLMGL
jgi:ABC-type multidrug transport system fused ATPase/permease subunit